MEEEKSVNAFVNEMRDAGFDFTFIATSADMVVTGECHKNAAGEFEIMNKKIRYKKSVQQSREAIRQLFQKGE